MNDRIKKTVDKLERFAATVDDAWSIPPEAGELIHGIILATGAKRAVEIGTSYGYSALWIASALAENGGRLITIDHEHRKSEAAHANLNEAGLADIVELRTGTALDILEELDGPFDFAFNDADKENCQAYVEAIADKLSDRAVVITDNTTTHAEELAGFMKWIRQHPDFYSTSVTVGNGMEISVRRTA
jgi:predicted O-methyltransferase YrrM